MLVLILISLIQNIKCWNGFIYFLLYKYIELLLHLIMSLLNTFKACFLILNLILNVSFLKQNCMDEIIAATTYLDLFLRTINEPNLLRVFLKFILYSKFDEKVTLLDTLINRINSNSKVIAFI